MTEQFQPKISTQELYDQLAAEKLNYISAQEKIESLTTEVELLKNEIALLRHQLYGTKSEKLKAKLAKSADDSIQVNELTGFCSCS